MLGKHTGKIKLLKYDNLLCRKSAAACKNCNFLSARAFLTHDAMGRSDWLKTCDSKKLIHERPDSPLEAKITPPYGISILSISHFIFF